MTLHNLAVLVFPLFIAKSFLRAGALPSPLVKPDLSLKWLDEMQYHVLAAAKSAVLRPLWESFCGAAQPSKKIESTFVPISATTSSKLIICRPQAGRYLIITHIG